MRLQIGKDGGFELTQDKLELVNRCIDAAEEHFQEHDSKRYGEVCWWDDGDFRVSIRHGEGVRDDYRHEAEEIKAKASAGRIVYVRFIGDMLGREEKVIEEFTVDRFGSEVEEEYEEEEDE